MSRGVRWSSVGSPFAASICRMAGRHPPHRLPAPHAAATPHTPTAPQAMASPTARSLTTEHWHRITEVPGTAPRGPRKLGQPYRRGNTGCAQGAPTPASRRPAIPLSMSFSRQASAHVGLAAPSHGHLDGLDVGSGSSLAPVPAARSCQVWVASSPSATPAHRRGSSYGRAGSGGVDPARLPSPIMRIPG